MPADLPATYRADARVINQSVQKIYSIILDSVTPADIQVTGEMRSNAISKMNQYIQNAISDIEDQLRQDKGSLQSDNDADILKPITELQ